MSFVRVEILPASISLISARALVFTDMPWCSIFVMTGRRGDSISKKVSLCSAFSSCSERISANWKVMSASSHA